MSIHDTDPDGDRGESADGAGAMGISTGNCGEGFMLYDPDDPQCWIEATPGVVLEDMR